jgi:mono/diheme cytochrome c family protein
MGTVVKEYTVAMQKTAAKWLMVAGVTIGLTASGWAEEVDAGKAEYLSSCAPCHGADGKGKGPLSAKLKTKPADLNRSRAFARSRTT